MKVIVLLAGYGTRMRPHTWSRPKPLMKVAGNTVIGHILEQMRAILTDEVIFVVGYRGEQIETWIRTHYPDLKASFVEQAQAQGQAHAVWLCRDHLPEDGEVVVAFGDGVIKANYAGYHAAAGADADGVFTVMEVDDPRPFGVLVMDEHGYMTRFVEKPTTLEHKLAAVGINWFRSSAQLLSAIEAILQEKRQTRGEYFMADAYQVLLERGARIKTMPVEYWYDTGSPANILLTNQRLLGMGFGSPEALERSLGEGFTVIPPVYIHDSAEIEASVIGPYTHIDAHVTIKNAVISRSIIDARARLENCVLDNALIGEQAQVTGRGKALFVGDNASVDLG